MERRDATPISLWAETIQLLKLIAEHKNRRALGRGDLQDHADRLVRQEAKRLGLLDTTKDPP